MKKLTSNQLRNIWLNFFKQHDHLEVPSASLIPINDNSLLWINSGVATLKKYFSGKENPPYKNLTNSQKCIRTNDIFNVGVTSRHHTFFEMLGNFSIGGYFKEQAIALAFDLLINELEIDLDKLYFTVYEDDDITYNKWISLGVNKEHIIKCGRDRNFWDVGSGPCGPCTEIYYDRGKNYDPDGIGEKLFLDDIENDRYVEIWNIVFSEFNNDGQSNYTPLDRKNIDTGAGLERIACISQDVPTNFDTDLFQTIIQAIQKFANEKYDMNSYFTNNQKQTKINLAYKVIADHARASIFAIADGAIPSNKERGYILRRLIRRLIVMQHKLGIESNIFETIVNAVIEIMDEYYPYLKEQKNKIVNVLNKEYDIFKKTLDQGFKLYKEAVANNNLDANVVFKLVETYGFPIELIKELANDDGLTIDENKFNEMFKQHQEISKSNQNKIAMNAQNGELIKLTTPFKFTYQENDIKAKILKLYDENFNPVNVLNGDGYVVTDVSCCYATSGGQLHDIGTINETIIDDVIKGPNLQHIHHVIDANNLKLNDDVIMHYDEFRRSLLKKNHSVEHLIHATLTKLIDKNIKQEGAFKSPEKVTFDFQYHERLTPEQLQSIETEINQVIKASIPVNVLELTLEEAQAMGAKAYFEDVYKKIKSKLRVIKMGDVSCELCGGTHVDNTKEIEIFKITNFTSRAAGSWRIEGISSFYTLKNYENTKRAEMKNQIDMIKESIYFNDVLHKQLKTINFDDDLNSLILSFNKFMELYKNVKIDVDKMIAKNQIDKIKKTCINNINNNLSISCFTDMENKNIFNALSELINEYPSDIFVCFNEIDHKLQYMLATSPKNQLNLNLVIKQINETTNGKGGGKPNFVQGGTNSDYQLDELKSLIVQQITSINKGK